MNLHKLGLLAWLLLLADTGMLLVWAIVSPYVQRTMLYWSGGGEPYYAIHPAMVALTVLIPLLALAWALCASTRSAFDWTLLIVAAIVAVGVWVWRYPAPPFLG